MRWDGPGQARMTKEQSRAAKAAEEKIARAYREHWVEVRVHRWSENPSWSSETKAWTPWRYGFTIREGSGMARILTHVGGYSFEEMADHAIAQIPDLLKTQEEARARAKLYRRAERIRAAGPALLEACKLALRDVEGFGEEMDPPILLVETVEVIRRAVALAEGS